MFYFSRRHRYEQISYTRCCEFGALDAIGVASTKRAGGDATTVASRAANFKAAATAAATAAAAATATAAAAAATAAAAA